MISLLALIVTTVGLSVTVQGLIGRRIGHPPGPPPRREGDNEGRQTLRTKVDRYFGYKSRKDLESIQQPYLVPLGLGLLIGGALTALALVLTDNWMLPNGS